MISGRVIIRFNDFPELAERVETSVSDALDQANQVTVMVADPLTRRDTGALIGNKTLINDGERGGVAMAQPCEMTKSLRQRAWAGRR